MGFVHLGANKRHFVGSSSKNVAKSQLFALKAENNDSSRAGAQNFVSECTTHPKTKHPQSRYLFRSLQTLQTSSRVNYLPPDNEIPLIEPLQKPICEQVVVKPILTAARRP